MKGLLVKDLRLLLGRKQVLLFFVFILIIMGVSGNSEFMISYGSILFGIFAVNTLSYDEYDNGMPFLMTLPVTPKQYVTEKFILSGLSLLVGWGISFCISFCYSSFQNIPLNLEQIGEMFVILFVFGIIINAGLTIQLKFGLERSRIVLLICTGIIFLVGFAGKNILEHPINNFVIFMNHTAFFLILFAIIFLWAIISSVFFMLCIKIQKNKEY